MVKHLIFVQKVNLIDNVIRYLHRMFVTLLPELVYFAHSRNISITIK